MRTAHGKNSMLQPTLQCRLAPVARVVSSAHFRPA
jgi:hypothetical protein